MNVRLLKRFRLSLLVSLLGLGTTPLGFACGGMTFPGSLLCSPSGSLVLLGTISRPASPTAYPPNFIQNSGGGYSVVYPSNISSPSYTMPSYGYSSPSYGMPSYGFPTYASPSYLSPSYSYPGLGMASYLFPSFGLGGSGTSCNTPSLGSFGPYFGLGSYGGYGGLGSYNPASSYPLSSCGMGSLATNHLGSSCGNTPVFSGASGVSPRVVCVMCGLSRNLMRPISRARTLFSNRFY